MMKIGFLITARLKSTRLPFKVLMDLNGKTVIERIIDRAKEIKDISEIVICTSTNPQDKPLADIAKENEIYYFNGSEDDVLKRLLDAGKFFDMDYFVGITADNPLFSIHYSNRIIDLIKRKKPDYIRPEGLPVGVSPYGIKIKALEVVCEVKNIVDTEIWGHLIDRPNIFDVKKIKVKDQLNRPDLRLTLDYKEDYQMFNHVYSNIDFENVINLYELMEYFDKNPEIPEINKKMKLNQLSKEKKDRIDKVYKEKEKEIKEIKRRIYRS